MPIDYSKFDRIGDEEEEETRSKTSAGKDESGAPGGALLDPSREELRVQVEALLRKATERASCTEDDNNTDDDDHPARAKNAGSSSFDAALVAYFVATQRRDLGAPCNNARHVEIIDLLSKRPSLASDPDVTVALCAVAAKQFDEKDNHSALFVVEAINTLEAARRHGGALALFEAICAPTTERAETLRDAYARQIFGKLRLKRHLYRSLLASSDKADFEQVLRDHEISELSGVEGDSDLVAFQLDRVQSSSRARTRHTSAWRAWLWALLFPCVLAAIAYGGLSVRLALHQKRADQANAPGLAFSEGDAPLVLEDDARREFFPPQGGGGGGGVSSPERR